MSIKGFLSDFPNQNGTVVTALILIPITLALPVHTTISSQSNKLRTVTRVYFNVKHIPLWVMILSLGKSFFQFLLTE